ncbi:Serine/threonine-protein kinase StkP [Botrimarina hoheduenensis]|uniref:Serine/threonine-protein kinase StkP n=1 Tax=Botrimarina hoheduenensis TaxID=2528000 RepID=A0A5C5VYJ1_9BACT|nr:Serine/threonine-protein kinase StkP [Botrimarina hoheduenensis]
MRSTLFRQALVTSGLVDALLLNRIDSAVVAKLPKNEQQQDEYYAALLIESGRVNRWQIEQLNKGRTKFTLGAYRILDSIGSGGMGHVFKGEHELLGRVEAIKVLPHNRSTPEAIASFRHEIRAQAQLDHPNLVRVSYADRDGETYFLVTEYVPGIDLRRLIRRRMGPLPEGVAACLIEQAAVAIDYAHRRGLVHRDVKPGNLLLTPEGDVKVIDLGLAWFLDEDATGVTPQGKGKIVGTSDYLAPEVIRHPGRIVPVSDIYSLGCTLYYALTGKVPFPGGSHLEKMRRHVSDEPTNPLTLNDKLSPTAINLLGRMMAKNPRERIESAAQVVDALRWLHGEHDQLAAADLVAQALLRPTERKRLLTNDPSGNLPDTIGLPTDVSSRVAEQLHEREKQEAEDPVYDDGDTPASEPPGPSGSLWRRFTGG